METLKYKVIKNLSQYKQYCQKLEQLLTRVGSKGKAVQEEIDLLTLLSEKWDEDHNTFQDVDPITLLRSLMDDNHLKPKDLVEILQVSKGYVSEILNCKKGLSKEVIRKLASYFKLSQDAFNREYKLKVPANAPHKHASIMNTRIDLAPA